MVKQIGLKEVATYLPDGRVDNIERGLELGFEEAFLREKVGFLTLTQCRDEEGTLELAGRAVRALSNKTKLDLASVDCIVVCTQNPDDHGLPNTASALHAQLGLSPNCAAFDVSLGCSGYVYGLAIVKSFMEANQLVCGLLVTADPYSKIVDPADKSAAILFGDGATASLLTHDANWSIGQGRFGSDGSLRAAISVGEDGRLNMNGRAVFSFSATIVPPLVKNVVELNDMRIDEIDLFILHQGSRYIVEEIRKRLGLSAEKVPFFAKDTGNLVSSSVPAILEQKIKLEHDRVLLAGFGVGLSWAAILLTRCTED